MARSTSPALIAQLVMDLTEAARKLPYAVARGPRAERRFGATVEKLLTLSSVNCSTVRDMALAGLTEAEANWLDYELVIRAAARFRPTENRTHVLFLIPMLLAPPQVRLFESSAAAVCRWLAQSYFGVLPPDLHAGLGSFILPADQLDDLITVRRLVERLSTGAPGSARSLAKRQLAKVAEHDCTTRLYFLPGLLDVPGDDVQPALDLLSNTDWGDLFAISTGVDFLMHGPGRTQPPHVPHRLLTGMPLDYPRAQLAGEEMLRLVEFEEQLFTSLASFRGPVEELRITTTFNIADDGFVRAIMVELLDQSGITRGSASWRMLDFELFPECRSELQRVLDLELRLLATQKTHNPAPAAGYLH